MKIRPYLTFNGNCQDAILLYKRAFNTDTIDIMRFRHMPSNPEHPITPEQENQILQATLKFGNDFIRLSDGNTNLNDQNAGRISLSVECSVEDVKLAFSVLSEKGHVEMPVTETFYSPCTAILCDQFGIMWTLVAEK